MSTRLLLLSLSLALALGCDGAADASSAAAPHGAGAVAPSALPAPLQFEPGRNFTLEFEDFEHLVRSEHADPGAIHKALKGAPSQDFTYTTVAGTTMCGTEYKLQGPKPDAPFFEAFAASYPGQSFYVFFEKSWFRWRAVDCGFHESSMFGTQVSEP